ETKRRHSRRCRVAVPPVSWHGPSHLHQRHTGSAVPHHPKTATCAGIGPVSALGPQAAAQSAQAEPAPTAKTAKTGRLRLSLPSLLADNLDKPGIREKATENVMPTFQLSALYTIVIAASVLATNASAEEQPAEKAAVKAVDPALACTSLTLDQ